jgi:hypothetical protein
MRYENITNGIKMTFGVEDVVMNSSSEEDDVIEFNPDDIHDFKEMDFDSEILEFLPEE